MPEQKACEPRYAYRLPPCPAYDVEGTESWLSEMAKKGFVLTRDGFFAGFGIFEITEPQPLRYRLEASEKQLSAFSEACPPGEAEELYASFGWRYVAARGQFRIYCTDSDAARELNSDPRVQAIALGMVRKREAGNLAMTLFWLLAYPLLSLRSGIVRTAFALGTPLVFLLFAVIAWSLVRSIRKVLHLHRLGKSLSDGNPLDHEKDWRAHALGYRAGKLLYPLLWLVLIFYFLNAWSADIRGTNKIPLAKYNAALPFATIADFAPEGNYRQSEISNSNTVTAASRLLAPAVIEYRENAHVALQDGAVLSGGLDVDYYETASPLLARIIAYEFQRGVKRAGHYTEYELPPLDADYAAGYMEYFPTIVLQKGRRVLRATFFQTGTSTIPYEDWVKIVADSLD
ncbi:MAG: DUF2812 domain-containing protein [bacterium]|nr:DUF2812 domain-containing protein [bacterium]